MSISQVVRLKDGSSQRGPSPYPIFLSVGLHKISGVEKHSRLLWICEAKFSLLLCIYLIYFFWGRCCENTNTEERMFVFFFVLFRIMFHLRFLHKFLRNNKPGKSIVICTVHCMLSVSPCANWRSALPNGQWPLGSILNVIGMLTGRTLRNTF